MQGILEFEAPPHTVISATIAWHIPACFLQTGYTFELWESRKDVWNGRRELRITWTLEQLKSKAFPLMVLKFSTMSGFIHEKGFGFTDSCCFFSLQKLHKSLVPQTLTNTQDKLHCLCIFFVFQKFKTKLPLPWFSFTVIFCNWRNT